MEYVILGYLRDNRLTGYDLKKMMERGTGYFYDASFGSIYPTLSKLEKKGWIFREEVKVKSKQKIYYALTDAGKEAFKTWLHAPSKEFKLRYEFLAKLFFSRYQKSNEILEQIKEHRSSLNEDLKNMEETYGEIEHHCDQFELYTLQFGIEFLTFLDDFYRKTAEDIAMRAKKT